MFLLTQNSLIKRKDLYKTKEKDLKRFANYLGLKTEGYSHKHRARLVLWYLKRNQY